uniref:Peptidase M14 domain-containing protein n=1 Tax=Phlebotomus papatasi TaxID=29031 RepID=A0A1B0DDQ7_PHLPP
MKFVILGILIAFVVADPARFDNYRVYSVSVESEDNLKVLRSVNRGLNGYDFLVEPRILGDTADIIVPPHLQNDFEQLAKKHELKVELVIPDLQHFDVNEYHSTEHINEWLYYLAEQYPEVQIIRGGSTFEGRDIIGININRRGDDSPGIFIESNIHAREWITSASTVWMINKLLTATENEPEYKDLADNINWYIFPVVNVDGYEYSRDVYRMWRKTRSRQGFICHGVDPNRNWDTYWQTGGTGASDNMCDGDFGGPEAFSEIETETLSDYILSIQDKLNIYISFHSAAELLLFPWGHTSDPVPGFEDFNTIAQTTVDALRERHGTQYRFGSINQAIYPATGGSIDWVFLRLGILSYCYEFRSRNTATEIKDLADNINWYIFPIINVDGYEYTRNVYRMWRKTRSQQGLICNGVDPNRNWDVYWEKGGIGSSANMCDGSFAGPEAFSEIETKSLSEYILSLADNLNFYISFHSAANMLLFPWATINALHARHGTNYTYGPVYSTIYPTTGISSDWVHYALGIPGFTYEFRNRNTATGENYGFLAPPEEIQPNAEEVLDSLVALVQKATELGYMTPNAPGRRQ